MVRVNKSFCRIQKFYGQERYQHRWGGRKSHLLFNNIISLENLFSAWKEFKKGKTKRPDVHKFEFNLEDSLFELNQELKTKIYFHSDYNPFYIADPKLRHIHKAEVKDRIVHQAIFRVLYPVFDKNFIHDSYSCRVHKGTHRAVIRLNKFCNKLSKNNSINIYVLKCDIKKFFDSVDQNILSEVIKRKVCDENTIWLIQKIIKSFEKEKGKGLPLGNVTSQLFANIYLNELDQFVKHKLKVKYYIRYCDDFVILGKDKNVLFLTAGKIDEFLNYNLSLSLHSDKIIIRKYRQGVDFLGYVVLPYHRVVRTRTKRRIFRKLMKIKKKLESSLISKGSFNHSIQSYLGILKHCNGYKINQEILNLG